MDSIVDRIGHVGAWQELAPGARNRFVVSPGEMGRQSPFVLLVEDLIEPGTDFHPHPHKGLETVTFVLSGSLRHGDNVGNRGVIGPGDVQWMTAGSGIVHGGQPTDAPVHALQLWVALPAALRNARPGTREQRKEGAVLETANGSTVRTYGAGSVNKGEPHWSRWPLTLIDFQLAADGQISLPSRAGQRTFVYVFDGAVLIDGNRRCEAGSVVWLHPDRSDRPVTATADGPTRLIQYSSPVIDEPIVARGPL